MEEPQAQTAVDLRGEYASEIQQFLTLRVTPHPQSPLEASVTT